VEWQTLAKENIIVIIIRSSETLAGKCGNRMENATFNDSPAIETAAIVAAVPPPNAEGICSLLHSMPLNRSVEQLPPDRRALYERIVKRRQEVGRIAGFNIVDALREIRGDGG
jgi:hypothetical protein